MKASKSIKFLALSLSLIYFIGGFSVAVAQEYDDMYFNKSDRKTVKVKNPTVVSDKNTSADYSKITESTETYSAKNVNPEYIARYKSTEANEVDEQVAAGEASYDKQDYFVEDYDKESYVGDTDKNNIDYEALALRDKMSSSNNYSDFNRSFSNPSWRFSPYMSMGMGYMGYNRYPGFGYNPYMMGGFYDPYMMGGFYDPFMMGGYGSGMTMGIGMGFGSGFSPAMSYNIGMSWGSGFGYPGFYSPYGMGGYGYSAMNSMYCPIGMSAGYGYYGSNIAYATSSGTELNNRRNIHYQPRTTRSSANVNRASRSSENVRTTSNGRVRIPNRDVSSSAASNGRVSNDYSRAQNEYYSRSRTSSSSGKRISNANSNRGSYVRNSGSSTRSSSMYRNKPSSKSSNAFSSGSSRSSYSNRSSYTGNSSSSPSRRSSSSYSSSQSRSNSYSSGSSRSSSFSSGGSRSSGSSYSGSRSSGGASRSGGRQ